MSRFSMDWSELSLQVMITFGHFLWQACVVGVVLLVLQHVAESLRDSRSPLRLRRSNVSLGETGLRGANIRYTIACVAYFSLPICVIATFAWVHQSRGPIMLVASDPVESPSTPAVSENEAIPTMANTGIPVLPPSVTPMNSGVPVTKPIEPPTLVVEPQTTPVQRIGAFAPYLLLAYIVGVSFMLARFLLSIIGSSRLRRTIQPITDVKLLRTIAQQCARVGLKRIPIVALCQRVSVPVVAGIVKPMILLPPALFCGLDSNQVAAILSHELAHIRRYDLVVNFLQCIVEALLFFHPVTWWISRRVSIERENCCDDLAAAGCGRLEYAAALLRMAERCAAIRGLKIAPQLESLAADGGNPSQLGYRIKRLLGENDAPRISLTRGTVAAIALTVVFGGLSMIAVGQSSGDKTLESQASNDNNHPWGEESHGLRCRVVPVSPLMDADNVDLSVPQDRFESPDDMTFAVEIENVSDKPISIRDIRYGEGYAENTRRTTNANHFAPHLFDFNFTDAEGNAIARTQREFVLDTHALILRDALISQIEPNQKLKFLLQPSRFERSMDYRLAPGDYRVQVRYRGPSKEAQDWIESNRTSDQASDVWDHQVSSQFSKFSIAPEGYRKPDLEWGAEVKGLRAALEIRVPRDSGIPTQAPGIETLTSRHAVLHVKNVSDQPITFVSETGRQGDTLKIKTANGEDVEVKDVWFSGEPIDVRWSLQPSQVAELDVLTPSLNQDLSPGEYLARYTIRFNSRRSVDKDGNQTFPAPGDYDSDVTTGWTPLFLRNPNQAAGIFKGRITLEGVVPTLSKLRVPSPKSPRLRKRATDEELKKYEASLVEIDDESIQVDADQGLANAFVYLAKAPSNWQPGEEDLKPFTLKMQDDRFAPRAAIVRTGQDVRVNNASVGADNFAFEPLKNDAQNREVGARAEITLEHPFTIPERMPIQAKSQMHPWKTTFLLPLDHPFAAITDSHGKFSIEGLPPGEHQFLIWHERTGWLEKSFVVRIEAGQTTSTDRAFSVDRFQSAQQALLQKGRDLSGKRKDLVQRIDSAANQRDQAKRYSSDFYRLDHTLKNQELLLAKFDLENATANIDVPNAPQATPERIAELRELLRIRWGLAVDGIQLGLGMIGDRSEFEPSERISFQVYIRNATEERIAQKLRWFDAANSTSLLRCLAGSPNNIFLSIRSGSSPGQETELHLEPGEIRELPRGRFEMDTAGLHPGVYSVDANFPVVFPNQAGEFATRIARPIDSDGTPFELLFHFELIGVQPPLDVIPPDTASEIIEASEVKWGTPVFGLQAGARFRNDATISGEIDTGGAALLRSSIKHHTHIGDTVKTELLVRNISNQPIEVRFQPAMGKETQSLSAMESALTEQNSRAIMRRSPVEAVEKSTRTIERTLQPGEHFIVAHQDFEIQQPVDGRERQLSRPETNRHWVPGHGDYMYRAYLKLGITDSLSVSLHSGGIAIRIVADENPQGANQAVTTETMAPPPGEPNMNDDLKEISELIASGETISQELNDKYQAVHLKLTAAERLKSVKLLAVADFVMQVVLSESTYSLEEKVALLSEFKDRNFGKLEFGMQECMANLATEYAQTDQAATRKWLAQFQGAEYGVGMGLTAVLNAANQKDPATSLEMLRSLSDAEAECIVTCGDIPKYDLLASDWLKEVQQFQSQRLRTCFLGGPMVYHFAEESPEAALDYILSIPKETRTPQLGYQLVSCILRSKRFTWTEILDWMETKLPIETRSPEHYGLLADTWLQQDNASFQLWFQELKDPVIRDEAIWGIHSIGRPQDWAAMLALAHQITDQTKRQSKVAWVLDAWKLTDPSAALAQLDTADVSKERRTQLHRDITARLKQVGNVAANDSSRSSHWIPARPLKVTASNDVSAKILDDHSVRLEGDVQWQEASLQFAFDKPTYVQEIRLEILPVDSPTGPQFGRGGKELMLFEVKPGIEDQTGKFTSLDFASCTYLQNPSDDTTVNCIDYLSDTGWKVPPLPADETAHELVLRFEKPIALRADKRLTLTVDSGGAKELAVLNRIRVAFRQRTDGEAVKPSMSNESKAPTDDDVTTEQDNDSPSSNRSETGTVVLYAIDADTGEPIRDVTFVKENAVREDWATPVGRSDADGTVRFETKPLPGYFFSILPVPQGYKVTSLDEVPARVQVGDRVDYQFHLRKLGTNLDFVKNVLESNPAGNRFAEALKETNQKSLQLVVNDMPGFREQPVSFSFARDHASLAERIFANGELVREAVNDELRYFEKAEGNLAGKISELYDIQVVISNSTLPKAPATSWYLYLRTKDGIELKQDGFRIRFEDLNHWDLEIPDFFHPEF